MFVGSKIMVSTTFTQVLKNRGFLNLWINQILVQLSYNSLNFALIIWVFRLTDSNTAVSALLFAIYLPAVIFGLFTGVLVDILDRRRIFTLINFSLSLAIFSLIFLKESYLATLFVTFFMNALGQFYAASEASSIPIIVKKNQLITANSIFSTTLYSSFLIGFGLSGPLITHLGIDSLFTLGGFSVGLAFLATLTFPKIKATPDVQGEKLIRALKDRHFLQIKEVGTFEILETIKLIQGKLAVLTSITILAGVQMMIGILATLLPGFLERTLRIEATDAAYILIVPLGVGIVVGGLILGRIGQRLVRRILVARAIFFGGILFLMMGMSPIILPAIKHLPTPKPLPFFYQPPLSAVFVVGSFLLGAMVVSILVPSQTALQENTPQQDRGKVFSVLGVAMAGLSLIPVLLSGILADIFGTTPIFIGLGIIIMLFGLFGLKPSWFFTQEQLPYRIREFLGLGHWEKNVS